MVNTTYLPDGDIKELPFDVRRSRPLVFFLENPAQRGVTKDQADPVRMRSREDLARKLERALQDTLATMGVQRTSKILDVTPHLLMDDLDRFHVVFELLSPIPFQADYLVKEPSGFLSSNIRLRPAQIDPKDRKLVRFQVTTLKYLPGDNNIYVLSGQVAHLPTAERPVPTFHSFEVQYRVVNQALHEIARQQPPAH